MKNITKILTVGVYDYFHLGHLRLFKSCKKIDDMGYLIVAVQDGDFILRRKPNANVLYTTEERVEMIKSLRCVDKVITYKNIEDDIEKIDFDIFVTGPDQNHDGFQKAIEWCKRHNKKHLVISRTEGISTTKIKAKLGSQLPNGK